MGLALRMYVEDNRNQYPFCYMNKTALSWEDALGLYYPLSWTTISSYLCPGYRGVISKWDPIGVYLGSYTYNAKGASWARNALGVQVGLGFGNDLMGPAITESKVSVPTEMIVITDNGVQFVLHSPRFGYPAGTPVGDDINDLWPSPTTADPFAHIIQKPPQHGRNFNVLFCDAHVSPMSVTDLIQSSKSASLWNYDHQPHREGWWQTPWP